MFFENLKLALSSMKTNKMRTFLSLLGIVIGVGSFVAILNLGQSDNESILSSMEIGGLDMVNVMPTGWSRKSAQFDEEFADNFRKNVEGIDKVIVSVSSNSYIRAGQEVKTVSLTGVTSDFFDANMLTFLAGDAFKAIDNINRKQVVVLGHDLAEDLFPAGDAVGSYVSIFRNQAKKYQVVGVLEEKDSTLGASYNSGAYIPYNTYDQRFRKVYQVSAYTLKVKSGYDATVVADNVSDYLYKLLGSDDNYMVYSPAQIVEMTNEITKTFSIFLAAIAAISLIVGGIGIMNIMLVSVVERTREIGVRKALGATPRTIQGQFLVESITLTLLGGFLGLAFGTVLSYAVVTASGWSMHYSWTAIAVAIGFSAFVGIFFGWYPARKAAKLDPIEALAYE